MPIRVQLPDGKIAEYPDGTDHAVIEQSLASYTRDGDSMTVDDRGQPMRTYQSTRPGRPLTYTSPANDQRTVLQHLGDTGYDVGVGALEAPLAVATGTVGSIAAGYRGLGNLIAGNGLDEAANATRETQDALSYQPRTETGKAAVEAAGLPGELIGKGSEKIADVTGIPALGVAANVGGNAALFGLGGRAGGGLKGRAKFEPPRSAPQQVIDNQVVASHKAGFSIDPNSAMQEPGRSVQKLSDQNLVRQQMSVDNAAKTVQLTAQELGLPQNTPITEGMLAQAEAPHIAVYEAVKNTGPVTISKKTLGQVAGIKDYTGAEEFSASAPAEVQKMKVDLLKDLMPKKTKVQNPLTGEMETRIEKIRAIPAEAIMGKIRDLRFNAGKNLKADSPKDNALGAAQLKASEILQNALEDHVAKVGQPGLIDAFKTARRGLAKINVVKDAITPSGQLSAQSIAKYDKATNGKALTGNLRIIADTVHNFPAVMQDIGKLGNLGEFGPWDAAMALFGHTAGRAVTFVKPVARAKIRSPKFQENLAKRAAKVPRRDRARQIRAALAASALTQQAANGDQQ